MIVGRPPTPVPIVANLHCLAPLFVKRVVYVLMSQLSPETSRTRRCYDHQVQSLVPLGYQASLILSNSSTRMVFAQERQADEVGTVNRFATCRWKVVSGCVHGFARPHSAHRGTERTHTSFVRNTARNLLALVSLEGRPRSHCGRRSRIQRARLDSQLLV
jgi:hypothetical protein